MKTREIMDDLPEIDQLRAELHRVRCRNRYASALRSTLGALMTTAAAVILLTTFWFPVLQITGGSMEPLLREGDIVICLRGTEIAPGDPVSFWLGSRLLVKRCIAGSGQWVDMDEAGTVFLDELPLEEDYIMEKSPGSSDVQLPCQVPEGKLFCLGDNRAVSVDSRHSAVGFVSREQIEGKPVLRIWPLSRFGLLEERRFAYG